MADVAAREPIKKMLSNCFEISEYLSINPGGIGSESTLRRCDPQRLADKESAMIPSDSVDCVAFGHAFVCLSTGIGQLR